MTSDESGEVDIDLLADYIGGALDGPDEAEVARLIDEDQRWRETYDLLAPGMAAVGAELSALVSEPMPADLASRLEASFGSPIASPTTIDPVLAEPTEPHLVPSSGRHLSSVPGTGVDRPARKRKRLRWAVPVAVAAGVLAFAGFGGDFLAGQISTSEDSAQSAAGSAENAAPMVGTGPAGMTGLIAPPSADQIMSTGTDYGSAELAAGAAKGPQRNGYAGSPDPALSAQDGRMRRTDLAGLERLSAPEALLACLEAISRQNGQGPIQVQTVDYARYQGAPALVVRFSTNGTDMAWAVGPDCGLAGGANRL